MHAGTSNSGDGGGAKGRGTLGLAASVTVLAAAFAPKAGAGEIRVPLDRPTIQAAIDAALPGDVVLVAPGVYAELLHFRGRPIVVRSTHGPELTTLDVGSLSCATGPRSAVLFDQGEGRDCVLEGLRIQGGHGERIDPLRPLNRFGGGILVLSGSSPTLRGNEIVSNRTDGDGQGGYGAGLYIGPGCSPSVEGNHFEENWADGYYGGRGGALAGESATLEIVGNVFESNYARRGGGVYADDCDGVVRDNTFLENRTDWGGGGGGSFLQGRRSPRFSENRFVGNVAQDDEFGGGKARGGAIYCDGCDLLELDRDRFESNFCYGPGGALHLRATTCWIRGILVVDNQCRHPFQGEGGGAYVDAAIGGVAQSTFFGNSSLDSTAQAHTAGLLLVRPLPVRDCVLWANLGNGVPRALSGPSSVRYCIVEGGWPGRGNLDVAPLLDEQHRPLPGSPCIDAGDPQQRGLERDLLGRPRFLDGDLDGTIRGDLGAVEFENVEIVLREFDGGRSMVDPDQVRVSADGTPGLRAMLFASLDLRTAPHLRYGPLYLDAGAGIGVPLGVLPSERIFPLPDDLPVAVTVWLQALALTPDTAAGNTSNLVELKLDPTN